MAITSTMIASEVVTAAMQELGVLAAGEAPTGEETVLGLRALNFMFKSWQSRGLTSWRDQTGSGTITANTPTVTLSPHAIDVTEVRAVQATNFERPLQRWEPAQYRQLPNKATPGYPTAYSVTKTANTIALSFWPVPQADTTFRYSYARVIEDVIAGEQALDVPQEWLEAAYVGLAARLAQPMGVTRTDPATTQILIQRAIALENELFNADRPASIYMGSAYGRTF